jgi:hypothetical protein
MVRFLSFLLSGAIVLGALAGCEKKTELPSNASAPPRGANLQDFSEHNDAPPPPPPGKRG